MIRGIFVIGGIPHVPAPLDSGRRRNDGWAVGMTGIVHEGREGARRELLRAEWMRARRPRSQDDAY